MLIAVLRLLVGEVAPNAIGSVNGEPRKNGRSGGVSSVVARSSAAPPDARFWGGREGARRLRGEWRMEESDGEEVVGGEDAGVIGSKG